MDEIDRAQAREQQDRDSALRVRKPQLVPCNICYNCGEQVSIYAEFCDADCCTDYERREAARARDGK